MGEPKPRKRIVAQLIVSPTHEREGAIAAVPEEAPQAVQLDQKEQAEWAREHLGPDRKVFVDLTAAANKEVDWKQLCKERGVQKPNKATAAAAENGNGDDPLLLRAARSGRQENSWTKMLAKLEATYCVGAELSEESDVEEREEEGSESGGSDDEEEGEDGEGDGGKESGREGGGKSDAEAGGKAGPKKGSREDIYDYKDDFIDDEEFFELLHHDKRKPKHAGFFITKGEIEKTDEIMPGFEELEKEKKRGQGGKRKAAEEAESDERGDGGAPAAKEARAGGGEKKKRKAAESGGEGGEPGDKPAAKKKKKAAGGGEASGAAVGAADAAAPAQRPAVPADARLSIAELARMAGAAQAASGTLPPMVAVPPAGAAGAAAEAPSALGSPPLPSGSQVAGGASGQLAPPSAKKKVPYEMPREVEEAIGFLKTLAQRMPPPAPAPAAPAESGADGGDEGKQRQRRSLPKEIKDALLQFAQLYQSQVDQYGHSAQTPLITQLFAFLEPWASRMTLNNLLRNANKPQAEKKQATAAGAAAKEMPQQPVSEEQLRRSIAEKVKVAPVTSDDDFVAPKQRGSTSPPTQDGEAAGGGATQAAAAKPQLWRQIDRGVQQQVFRFLKQRLGDNKLTSAQGKLLQQEVWNWFPPGSIDQAGIAHIYNAGKTKEKRAAAAAAAASGQTAAPPPPAGAAAPAEATVPAAAAPAAGEAAPAQAAQPMGVAAIAAAMGAAAAAAAAAAPAAPAQQQQQPAAPQQQQQQQAVQPPAPAQPSTLSAAEAFAALAVAQAQQKLATPDKAATSSPTAPPAAPAVAAAAAHEVDAAVAEAAAAAAPPSQQAGQAAPPAAGLPRDPTFADLTGAARASDAESVARAQASGAPQSAAELQAILDSAYKASVYQYIYAKVLMHVGKEGTKSADAAQLAAKLGWATWDPTSQTVKAGLFRCVNKPHVMPIGKGMFVLRGLPGLTEVPRAKRGAKRSGSTAPSGAGGEEEEEEAEPEASQAPGATQVPGSSPPQA